MKLNENVKIKRNKIGFRKYENIVYLKKDMLDMPFIIDSEVGIEIWNLIEKEIKLKNIYKIIYDKFKNFVSLNTLIEDINIFIIDLYRNGLVEIYNSDNTYFNNQIKNIDNNKVEDKDNYYEENFNEKMNNYCIKNHIPIKVHFELTYNCNFNCVHCYNSKKNYIKNDLNTKQIKNIISQLYENGCFYLAFTGGEVFTRKDIIEIIDYSLKYNFLIRILTNGYLINDEIVNFLSNKKLISTEISIYGMSDKTYEQVTGYKSAFTRIINNIFKLLNNNVKIFLKYVALNINFHEILNFVDFCNKNKISFGINPGIMYPSTNGDKKPIKYNIGFEDYIDLIRYRFIDPKNNFSKNICVAANSRFSITPSGKVVPCEFLSKIILGDLKKDLLINILNSKKVKDIRDKISIIPETCKKCDKKDFCNRCPANSYLETGCFNNPSSMWCKFADIRKKEYEYLV